MFLNPNSLKSTNTSPLPQPISIIDFVFSKFKLFKTFLRNLLLDDQYPLLGVPTKFSTGACSIWVKSNGQKPYTVTYLFQKSIPSR